MMKRYLMLALILSIALTLSFHVFAQTKQKTQVITPTPRPIDLGPPKVVSFKINNGAANTTSTTVILNNVTERATLFCASERPDLQGAYWKHMHSAPQFTLSSGDGKKTVYFQVADPQGRKSPIVSDTIYISTTPTITSFKVISWGPYISGSTGSSSIYGPGLLVKTKNTATNNPTQIRLSEKADLSNTYWQTYNQDKDIQVGKGIGPRTVYLQIKNNDKVSKVYSATFNVPARKDFSIGAAKAKKYSQPFGFNFAITPKDITSRCEMDDSRTSIQLKSPLGPTGSRCDFTLFGNKIINQGWKFKSFSPSARCDSPGRSYSLEDPNAGSREIRFKVHLWTNPGKSCWWSLNTIKLEGPGDANWQEAFK